jgi:hypothetical protein
VELPQFNPFTPIFGKVPPFMAGREHIISDIVSAFDSAGNDPNLLTIFTGPRGTGKTALLSYLASVAQQHGWIAVNLSCKSGMLEDSLIQAYAAGSQFLDTPAPTKITGVNIAEIMGVQFGQNSAYKTNWRKLMGDVIDDLNRQNVGLLFTIDEVRPKTAEMIEFADVCQHFVRENKKIAVMMAGLPSNVSSLVSNEAVSFLRRARMRHLGRIADSEVAQALNTSILQAGRTVDSAAVEAATAAIDGFAYMIQLVGYRMWAQNPSQNNITLPDVQAAIPQAKSELEDGVLYATYCELSDGDIDFLAAMLEDPQVTKQADLAARLNRSAGQVRIYKERLKSQGIIAEERRGYLKFELPYFREYLQSKLG